MHHLRDAKPQKAREKTNNLYVACNGICSTMIAINDYVLNWQILSYKNVSVIEIVSFFVFNFHFKIVCDLLLEFENSVFKRFEDLLRH